MLTAIGVVRRSPEFLLIFDYPQRQIDHPWPVGSFGPPIPNP
jgi:hypothetical protein